jgi:hypothetical protein
MVQNLHIQQAKLETDGGAYQPWEKLEEVGLEPTQGGNDAGASLHLSKCTNNTDVQWRKGEASTLPFLNLK